MRARALPISEATEVGLWTRRAACPGGAAVGVRVDTDRAVPGDGPGRARVNRWSVAAEDFTRAYQPWHADVEPDAHARWQGYLHPNMPVTLRNLVGVDMPNALRAVEDDYVFVRRLQLAERPVGQSFDLAHLRAIHARLFGDVYPWAGETRTVDMARRGSPDFAPWDQVEDRFAGVAAAVAGRGGFAGASRAEFAAGAAELYDRVNRIHAFREGNGRSQREWVSDLARAAGYRVDWLQVSGAVNDRACQLAREGHPEMLRAVFDRITVPVDPAAAERASVERSVARLAATRAPAADILATPLGAVPGIRPAAGYRGPGADRGTGYDR